MINAKSVIGVIIVAMLVGVLYVVLEKNFTGTQILSNSQSSSAQELTKEKSQMVQPEESSLIKLPTPEPSPAPLTGSSDLLKIAEGLQMRDYSGLFEELKKSINQ